MRFWYDAALQYHRQHSDAIDEYVKQRKAQKQR